MAAAAAADGFTLGQGWERAGFHPLLCSASVRARAAEAAADGASGLLFMNEPFSCLLVFSMADHEKLKPLPGQD